MKAKPDCFVCTFNQALKAARAVSDDPEVHLAVLRHLAHTLSDCSLKQTPANLSKPAYTTLQEILGISDPYRQDKKESNIAAMEIAGEIRSYIEKAEDPLDKALHAAAAGNLIDMGIDHEFEIREDMKSLMNKGFAKSDLPAFRKELQEAGTLLYLGDNAGEIVFDKLLIERIRRHGVNVKFSVKSGPVINDATAEDAAMVGMEETADIIETGSDDIGINWQAASSEFKHAFQAADVIVSKGQGNFETCNERPENIFFLLKAKCDLVATELNVNLGEIVFVRNPGAS
jgi:hypothetical protein